MSRTSILFSLVIVYFFQSFDFGRADTIVDTGAGPAPNGTSPALYSQQWLAAAFTLTNSMTITEIQGWVSAQIAGNLTISLYTAGDSAPGTSVASTSFYTPTNALADWVGESGLNWTMAPGTYWVSFEVHNSTFAGSMPTPSASPLFLEGFYYVPSGFWSAGPSTNCANCGYGIRIYGNAVTQPTYPVIQNSTLMTAGTTNGFQFDIYWPVYGAVVIEASSNLVNSAWQPIQTNVLANGSSSFLDSDWTNFASRFYRAKSQ